MNPYSILVTFGLILAILFSVRTCSEKQAIQDDLSAANVHVGELQQDSTELKGVLLSCQLDAEKAKNYVFALQQSRIQREAEVVAQVKAMSAKQQRETALKGLVKNKALPADYKPAAADTGTTVADFAEYPAVDSAVVAAVAITNQWLTDTRSENDSLKSAAGTYAVALKNKDEELTDCKGENAELKAKYCKGFLGFFRRILGKCR